MPTLTPQQLDFIEQSFPSQARTVFAQAQQRALARGRSVLVSKDTSIYRLSPDGNMVFIKNTKPLVKVQRGAKIQLS